MFIFNLLKNNMSDNRVLNINGRSIEQLKLAVKVAMLDEYGKIHEAASWRFEKDKGLIFLWSADKKNPNHNIFPVKLNDQQVTEIAWSWLQSDEAKTVPCVGIDAYGSHDGDNEKGWRIYVEDWGHVCDEFTTIFAIRPTFLWYGK